MENVKLTIVRGLPGSGKSTYAKKLAGFNHFEADMFHMVDGEYKFNFNNIKASHEWCQNKVKESLLNGNNTVVSNTFTQLWEMQPYIDMAKELCIELNIVTLKEQYGNIHNVPEEIIEKMAERFEEINMF